jgi:hypothetical protein
MHTDIGVKDNISVSAAAIMIGAAIFNRFFIAASFVICEYIRVNDLSARSKKMTLTQHFDGLQYYYNKQIERSTLEKCQSLLIAVIPIIWRQWLALFIGDR